MRESGPIRYERQIHSTEERGGGHVLQAGWFGDRRLRLPALRQDDRRRFGGEAEEVPVLQRRAAECRAHHPCGTVHSAADAVGAAPHTESPASGAAFAIARRGRKSWKKTLRASQIKP